MKLSQLSYFKTGGTCEALHTPASLSELQAALYQLHRTGVPYFILGGGTNSLLSDEHWPGAVLSLQRMLAIDHAGELVTCQAGVANRSFVEYCCAHSFTGMEWMTALPGQIGATVRMNARCYGGEISAVVHSVTAVTAEGEVHVYESAQEIFHGYKDTLFMRNAEVIAAVTLRLRKGDKTAIAARMSEVEGDRVRKGQFLHPSCGCVFKNDYEVGVPSGVLLDKAEVRQFSQKHVFISPHHANFIFNVGGASEDTATLTLKMREAVYRQFSVWLRYEMEFLGNFSATLQRDINHSKPHDLRNSALLKLRHDWHSSA